MFGKHHKVPNWEASAAGPFDHWPTGLGFEYFLAFIGENSDQFSLRLVRGTTLAEEHEVDAGKMLDALLTDASLRWLCNQALLRAQALQLGVQECRHPRGLIGSARIMRHSCRVTDL
jgi:hypothetical protein